MGRECEKWAWGEGLGTGLINWLGPIKAEGQLQPTDGKGYFWILVSLVKPKTPSFISGPISFSASLSRCPVGCSTFQQSPRGD